jgi:hypothetical protein
VVTGAARGPARHGDIATAITRQRARFLQRIAEVDHATVRLLARAPLEDHARRRALAVNQLVGGVIDRQDGAVERDPGEQPARTRPRPDFRLELPIVAVAALRPTGPAATPASAPSVILPLTIESMPRSPRNTSTIVGRLHACLKTDAAARKLDETSGSTSCRPGSSPTPRRGRDGRQARARP